MLSCLKNVKVGDIATVCFEPNVVSGCHLRDIGGRLRYYPTPKLTEYQFDFPIIEAYDEHRNAPLIGAPANFGLTAAHLYSRYKSSKYESVYWLIPRDIRVVKIKKIKKQ